MGGRKRQTAAAGSDLRRSAAGAGQATMPRRRQAWAKTTNIRLSQEQWLWLRRKALARAMKTGERADASELMRDLIDRAMMLDRRTNR